MLKKLFLFAVFLTSTAVAPAELKFTYSLDNTKKTAVVTGYSGSPSYGKVYVPMQICVNLHGDLFNVVGIEKDALNNLIGVDTIVIPNTVEYIGYVNSSGRKAKDHVELRNFHNSPGLKYIQVASGNKVFKSTGAGILCSLDGTQVYRVPEGIDVSKNNGTLKMGAGCTAIAKGAFDGNHTITSLVFSKNLEYLHTDAGIHKMTSLESLGWATGGTAGNIYQMDNQAIIRKSDKRLIAYPPACREETYIVTPVNVSVIGDHAFANTQYLKEMIIPEGPRTLGNYAFENSSIETMTFPSTMNFVTNSGYGAFKNSKIKTLIWNAKSMREIPRDFMLDCRELTTIKCDYPFNSIGGSAFRNCVKLENVPPFDGETSILGDSIWANTGLRNVIYTYSRREYDRASTAKAVFADCKRLKKIDMSAYTISTDRYTLKLWESFAAGCDSLENVWLPGFVSLEPSCFNGCRRVNKLVLHQVYIEEGPIFTYNTDEFIMPMVYVCIPPNCGGCFDSPLEKLFANRGKGEICPQFHFEEQECWMGKYVEPSVNYIPGHAERHFPKATKQTPVIPLFEYRREDAGDKVRFIFTTAPMVKINEVSVNVFPDYRDVVPQDNVVEVESKYREPDTLFVYYEVNGIPYVAGYSGNQYPWKLEDIETGIDGPVSEEIAFDGNTLYLPVGASAEIYDLNGREVMRSTDPVTNLSSLQKGMYVVVCREGTATRTLPIRL